MCRGTIQECLSCTKPDCTNNYVRKPHKYSTKQIENRNAWARRRREKWRSDGLCTSCGKRPPRSGRTMCEICQAKFRQYKNRENHSRGVKPRVLLDGISLCSKCGNAPPKDGFKVCKTCYETNMRNLRKTPTHKGIKRENDGFRAGVDLFWRSSQSQKSG